jgi:hypothetical protein
MNLASHETIAATKTNVVVRVRRIVIQVRTEWPCIRPIVPIATTLHRQRRNQLKPVPIKNIVLEYLKNP